MTQVVTYYARGIYEQFGPAESDQAIEEFMRRGPFDIVLLPDEHGTLHGRADLLRHAAGLGYAPVDDQPFSDSLRKMVVLARRHTSSKN